MACSPSYAAERLQARRRAGRDDAERHVLHPAGSDAGQAIRRGRGRIGDHPGAVHPEHGAGNRAGKHRCTDLRQSPDLDDHVPGRTGGPEEPFPDRFQLIHVLGQEITEVEMLSGRLDVERLGRILDTILPVEDVDEWFLCGPLAMTDAVRGVLLERAVDAAHVHRELFHVGAPVPRRRPSADSGTTAAGLEGDRHPGRPVAGLTLPRDGDSILDETLRARSDAPYACKNAVCGTCRARVVEGKVEMDSNYALEPDELQRGFVLTCQSHPVTDRVVVDFDQ